MKQQICLHGLDVKNKNQLLALLQKSLPPAVVKSKLKEKYLNDNDILKYTESKLVLQHKAGYKVRCLSGVMVVSDKLTDINDVLITYDSGSLVQVRRLIGKLLASKLKFVLEEPDLELRIMQLRGYYKLTDSPLYDSDNIMTALNCHLPWQIYGVNKSWAELLAKPEDKPSVRQLRVKLRRLRSSLTFFKPLLPVQQADYWRQMFKSWTDLLSDAREYDVALLTCAKIRRSQPDGEDSLPLSLEGLLVQERQAASKKVRALNRLNKLTGVLADFLLFLQNTPVTEDCCGMRLKSFIRMRLGDWCDNLAAMPKKYPDMHDMEQLHKIRIKVKRFRYALQGVPEIPTPSALLRSLKSLQDMLGLLHDDYINDRLVADILQRHDDNAALRYEGAMFCGWERAKAEAALAVVPELWENFMSQLTSWRSECID